MKLLGVSGALRRGSTNTALIRAAARHLGVPVALADLRLPLYDADLEDSAGIPAEVQALADAIAAADAVLISTPEYNQSFSGVLKNALDWVSRTQGNPWEAKPVAIMAAASGRAGGARAAYALRLAMSPFRPVFVPSLEILVPKARSVFDEAGNIVDEALDRRLAKSMGTFRDFVG